MRLYTFKGSACLVWPHIPASQLFFVWVMPALVTLWGERMNPTYPLIDDKVRALLYETLYTRELHMSQTWKSGRHYVRELAAAS